MIDINLIENIKNQIEYDILKQSFRSETLDAAVSSIAALYTVSEPQEFSGAVYAPDFVQQRAKEIKSSHVEYVITCFEQRRETVYNIPKYLRAAIFNAPDTIDAYYTNESMAARAV